MPLATSSTDVHNMSIIIDMIYINYFNNTSNTYSISTIYTTRQGTTQYSTAHIPTLSVERPEVSVLECPLGIGLCGLRGEGEPRLYFSLLDSCRYNRYSYINIY
jgi:hypothetical protein